MDITVLMGSPNQNGSTHLLVESFKRGAEEAGHRVHVIDAAHAQVHPCTGCLACGYEGPCVQKKRWYAPVKTANFSFRYVGFGHSPLLFWHDGSAKVKSIVDRFCSFNSSLHSAHLKSALLTVAWNDDSWTFEALRVHYQTLVKYCGFADQGMILGTGCGTPFMTKHSHFIQDAYQLGKRL